MILEEPALSGEGLCAYGLSASPVVQANVIVANAKGNVNLTRSRVITYIPETVPPVEMMADQSVGSAVRKRDRCHPVAGSGRMRSDPRRSKFARNRTSR
jgi:hypothetical protein